MSSPGGGDEEYNVYREKSYSIHVAPTLRDSVSVSDVPVAMSIDYVWTGPDSLSRFSISPF